jgi:membrane protein
MPLFIFPIRDVFVNPPPSVVRDILPFRMKIAVLLIRSVRDYFRDAGMVYSASLAYCVMLAFIPLCILAATAVGYALGGHTEFHTYLAAKLIGLFPEITGEIRAELRNLIAHRSLGPATIALFAVLSFQLYVALQKALEAVFKVPRQRKFLGTILMATLIGMVLMVLVFVSFAVTALVPLMSAALERWFPGYTLRILGIALVKFVVPFFVTLVSVALIYMVVPRRRIRFKSAMAGALFTALMLELAKHVFTWYVGSVVQLGTIYGSLSAAAVLLLWVYYASAILLIGGELVHHIESPTHPP